MASAEQALLWTQDSLERLGWQPAAEDSPLARRLVKGEHIVIVNANAYWLCAQIPMDREASDEVDREALRLSDDWYLVKFGRDGYGGLALQLEALAVFQERAVAESVNGLDRRLVKGSQIAVGPVEEDVLSEATVIRLGQGVRHDHWSLLDRLGPNRYKLQWKGVNHAYDAYLTFNQVWACIQVPAPPAVAAGKRAHPALLGYLLRLNDHIHWARYGLDPAGQVVLSLELPVDIVNADTLSWALRTLSRYADDHLTEVQLMSRLNEEPRLLRLLSSRA